MEKIALTFPITHTGQTISELTLRRPKVRDLLRPDREGKSPEERELLHFVDLTEQPREALLELDASDYARLQEAYEGFFAKAPQRASEPVKT